VVEVIQPSSFKLQWVDGSEVPNSWNIDQLRLFYMKVIRCTFFVLACRIDINNQSTSQGSDMFLYHFL
jgi:hypothetical protein